MTDDYCDVELDQYCEDAEPFEFVNVTTPVARKEHKCDECGEPIPLGARYTKTDSKYDGTFHTDRECASCTETREEFSFTVVGGLLWSSFREEWANGANVQGCINRLSTAQAKEHMRRQFLKWKGLEAGRPRPPQELE